MSILANTWAERGWDVHLYYFYGEESFYPLHTSISYEKIFHEKDSNRFYNRVYNFLSRNYFLYKKIKQCNPDAVISFLDTTNIQAIIASLLAAKPVIVSERSNPFLYKIGYFWDTVRHWIYPFAGAIVFQTKGISAYFSKRINSKSVVIPNPVMPMPAKVEPVISFQKPFILSVGRFTEEKCFDLLIKAFSQIAAHCSGWRLVIAGDGPLRPELQQFVHENHLEESINLPGRISDISSLYNQASLFVLTSRFEGFPNALCEAMAAGLPVIATDCPFGPGDIIRDGIDGILIPVNDIDALANAIKSMITNEHLQKQFAAKAPEILQRFGLEQVITQWETIIHSVLKHRKA